MFIRKIPVKGTTHHRVQVCENVRVGAKVSQKVVKHVGIAHDEQELGLYLQLAEKIRHELETKRRGGALFDDFEARKSNPNPPKKRKRPTPVNVESLDLEQANLLRFSLKKHASNRF